MRRLWWRALSLGGVGLVAVLVWLLSGRAYHTAALRFHVFYAATIPAAGPAWSNQDKDWLGYTRQWHLAYAQCR